MKVLDSEIVRMHKAGIGMAELVIILALLSTDLALEKQQLARRANSPDRRIGDVVEHTLVSLARVTGMPISTASRVLWQIVDTHKLASYGKSHDRRKKPVIFNRAAYEKLVGLKGGFDR